MEDTQTQIQTQNQTLVKPKSAFKRKQRKTQQKSHMGNVVHECLLPQKRSRRQIRGDELVENIDHHHHHHDNQVGGGTNGGDEEEEDKEEVERKIAALQRIVPGGDSLGVDKLFEETAGYIMALQGQLKAMKALASFVEGLEKEKAKFEG